MHAQLTIESDAQLEHSGCGGLPVKQPPGHAARQRAGEEGTVPGVPSAPVPRQVVCVCHHLCMGGVRPGRMREVGQC